jgi:hypothetical protein
MPALDWLTAWQMRALRRGVIPAMTLEQMTVLRFLKQAEQQTMVAKVHGLGAFVGTIGEFQHPDWDDLAATMLQLGPRLTAARELAKKNVTAAVLACDQADAFNAAFGNGDPSGASGQSSGAQQQPQSPPASDKPANPQ